MTITEYEKKFTKLAKYAMTFVVDEENNCRCFEQGLRTTIRILVTTSMNWIDISKLIEAAMRVERYLIKEDERSVKKKKINLKVGKEVEKGNGEKISKQGKFYFIRGSY